MLFWFRKRPAEPVSDTGLQPDGPVVAIGDIHGCDALLARLLDRIATLVSPEAPIVCVGDYVDRGEDSARVLERLHRVQRARGAACLVCLRGNHDQMVLDFLDDPVGAGPRWVRYGGLQTLASYNVSGLPANPSDRDWRAARDRLRAALPAEIEAWLRGLPLRWQSGNVFICHAGADPRAPLDAQDEATLLWGHPDFPTTRRKDGMWVVHGHTIVGESRAEDGRLPVDTGAFATGRLTAALIVPGKVQLIQTP